MSRCADLNRGPTPYHGVALPTELQRHKIIIPNSHFSEVGSRPKLQIPLMPARQSPEFTKDDGGSYNGIRFFHLFKFKYLNSLT